MSVTPAMMVSVAAQRSLTMVGRDSELDEAAAVLEDAAKAAGAGAGRRVVLLAGDAGVGKTRLLRALRDRALDRGWQVFAGHCLDFAESALPYLPFSEVLGRFGADRPDLVDAVAAEHPSIARLLPGRRLQPAADESASGDVAQSGGRGEVFDAVHALLDRAAGDEPLLLVVEDLHWADQSTRDMLGFLFTRAFTRPVAIVASYRSDDLHRRHPLRRKIADWSRLPQVARISLAPLRPPHVRALVRELAPDGIDATALSRIVERAEGNAFFVEELVASASCLEEIPGELADVLLVRLDRLDDHARDLVRVASVAGRRVSHDLLSVAAAQDAATFEAGVRQAVEMNILEVSGDRYSFRHALLGEAVYDDLLPGERVRIHAAYVDALVDGTGRGMAAELALHARRANDLDRAVTASIGAGDEAMAVGGPDEAAHHYQQALELLEDPARVERLDIVHSKLVVRAARALVTSGDVLRAAHLLADQVERLGHDAPPLARPRMLSEWADQLCIIETDLDPVAVSAEAVALAPDGESPLRAQILSTHARVLSDQGHADEAEGFAAEALALAERLSLPVLVSEAATTLSGLRVKEVAGTEQELIRSALEKAVVEAAGSGARQAELRGRFLLGRSHQDAGDWDQAARWFASTVEIGERDGVPWAPFVVESRWQLAWIDYLRGDWDTATVLADAARAGEAPEIPHGILAPVRLAISGARGADAIEVLAALRELRRLWEDEGGIAVYSAGVEIELHGLRGDTASALAAYDAVTAVLTRIWGVHFGGRVRLAAQVLGAIARGVSRASAVERASLLADADRARADADGVLAWFREHGDKWGREGIMWADRMAAEHLRVQWLAGAGAGSREDLLDAWASALASTETLGHVPEEARVRASYSQILRLAGDPAAGRDQATAARAIADRLGATALLGDELADVPTPAAAPGGPDRPRAALTPRELEILALVAEGRSNGEIGKQLFISTKTVSVHVSNILGKLTAGSRTEAAAIARRENLLP